MLAAWVRREEIREAREQGRTEGRVEGRAEGRDEERGAWLDWRKLHGHWEQRKAEAEKEGWEFTDPRPLRPDEV